MQDINDIEADSEQASLDRCRELLGDEAAELSAEQVSSILRHAQAMADVLVELFLSGDSRDRTEVANDV
jgi:hypothetical protein